MFLGYDKFVELMKRIEVQYDSPILQYAWQFFDDDPSDVISTPQAFTVEIQTSSNGTQFLYFQSEETNFITFLDGFPAVLYPGGYVVQDTTVAIPSRITRYDVNGTVYYVNIVELNTGNPADPNYQIYYSIGESMATLDLNTGIIDFIYS